MVILFVLVGLLLVAVAIPLWQRKIGPNSAYGVRVAATLNNEDVWYEANARSGRELVFVGIANAIIAVILHFVSWPNPGAYELVCSGVLLLSVLFYCLRAGRIAQQVNAEFENQREGLE